MKSVSLLFFLLIAVNLPAYNPVWEKFYPFNELDASIISGYIPEIITHKNSLIFSGSLIDTNDFIHTLILKTDMNGKKEWVNILYEPMPSSSFPLIIQSSGNKIKQFSLFMGVFFFWNF